MRAGIFSICFLLCSLTTFAQNLTVTGKVVDKNNETIIGATIIVVGVPGQGTTTDFDGNYTLPNVAPDASLQFSYVGMKTQVVPVNGRKTIDVVMTDDTEMLEEVVVTALGMKRAQKALGYAVTEVKGDEIKEANTINPVSALQGKVAGVDIKGTDGGMFGGAKIQIRGASTLGGNTQPIYVVDGVILDNSTSGNTDLNWGADANDYGNALKNLNPDDFETVSVLKGAAATALYGSRGLNGAVVITTKGGGKFKGFGVTVSQTLGFDHVFETPELQNKYGIGLWPGYNSYSENRWDIPDMPKNSDGVYSLINTSGMAWGGKIDGRPVELYDKKMGVWEAYPNNYKDMFDVGINSNTNLSIQGGNEVTSFYSSMSYRSATGTTPNHKFERLSFLLKGSHKISDRLNIAASVSWARSKPQNAPINFGEYFIQTTLTNQYDPNYYRDKFLGDHGGIANTKYGDEYGSVPGKSLWFRINYNNYYQIENVYRPTVELTYDLTDWAKLTLEGNMNYYTIKGEEKVLGDGYANEGGYYGIWQRNQEQVTLTSTLHLNKTFGDFDIGGFLRGEYYNNVHAENSVSTKGGLVVPGQYFIGNSKENADYKGIINGTKRIYSLVFAFNTAWKNQIFLDITGRNDWSSALLYTNITGNYSYFYPSVSGSWLFTETFEMPSWITFGKLRASWAQVGNDTSPYFINQGYSLGKIERADGYIYTNSVPERLFDPNIKPERKNSFEVGSDIRFLNNRIGLDATFYKENTKDQIIEISVPWISGVNRQLINAGNIQNMGYELGLKTVPYRNKDFEWNLDMTYTQNRSKIVELHPNVTNFIEQVGQPNNYDFRIGSVAMVNGAYGVVMSDILPKKNEKGETVLRWSNNGRGAYPAREGEVKKVGDINPKFLASLQTGLKYKNFNFRVALDARYGGLIASYANRYGTAYGITGTSLKYRDSEHGGLKWTSQYTESKGITYNDGVIPEGVFDQGVKVIGVDGKEYDVSGQSYAKLVDDGVLEPTHAGFYHHFSNSWGQGTINDNWVHELKYIALREISLGYQLSKKIATKLGAQGAYVSLSARNLGYLYNSLPNNLHPETVRSNVSGEFRIRAYDPYTANYMFTVTLNF